MEARIEKYHNLFVAHYGDLCNYASLFVPRHDAEDVVSDIFTGLIETKNLPRYPGTISTLQSRTAA